MDDTTSKELVQEILWLKDRIKSLEEERFILKERWVAAQSMAVDLLDEIHAKEIKKDY